MAYGVIEVLKTSDGHRNLWLPNQYYVGPHYSNGYIQWLRPSSSGTSSETISGYYGLPWNDNDSALTYANEAANRTSVEENYSRLALVLNTKGSAMTERDIVLKSGVTMKFRNQSRAYLRFYDSNNNLLYTVNDLIYAQNVYSHALFMAIDKEAQEAFVGSFYWNPDYSHSGSNQEFGWLLSRDSNSQANRRTLYNILINNLPIPDPYNDHNNNYSNPIGGQTGTWDETSDTIVEPAIPTLSGVTTGFVTAYVPTLSQINDLADKMVDPNIWQGLGNTILDLSDVVVSLSLFPFQVPKIAADRQVRINLLGIHFATGAYVDKATAHYVDIDCGSLEVKEYWANCMDYNPYTKISIYLPFCGFYELDTDDVMGKTLKVKYRVDIMSGSCLATIFVNNSVMYQYAGQCSSQIPISSVSYDSFMQSMINVGVATATGGAGLAAAGAASAGDAGAAKRGMEDHGQAAQLQHEMVQATFNKTVVDTKSSMLNAAVGAVMSAKGQYKHAGAMQGIAGFMGVKKPYLIIKRPNQQIPSDYGKYHGYPAVTKAKLGDLEGYTVVDDIRLNIPEATVEEIIECEKLLKGGIII